MVVPVVISVLCFGIVGTSVKAVGVVRFVF